MLKLKLQYFGHLMGRADSLEKTLMLGMTEGRRSRGRQRMRWLDGTTDSMDVSLSKLQETVKNREFWHAAGHEVPESYMTWQLHNNTFKYPRDGNGNPLQYSCLENLMDRGTWWATVHRVTESRTQLKRFSTPHSTAQHSTLSRKHQYQEAEFTGDHLGAVPDTV